MKKRISLVQMDVVLGDPQTNYRKVIQLLTRAVTEEKPDIILLPETFNVGFFPKENLDDLADVDGARTKTVFGKFAREHEVNIVAGSVANRKAGSIYNTVYVFDRAGEVVCEYDKIHGFTPAEEQRYFTGGKNVVNFMLDDIRCSCVVCYDLRFPELIRTATLQGVDLMFIPAQWPLLRKQHWITLVTARAIENQMFVCAVNGCGYADTTKYGGNSLLINPWGESICHLGEQEEIQSGEIDMSIIKGIRESINIFRDRKPEYYRL